MCRDGLGCYGEGVVYLGIFVWFTLLTGSWCAIRGLQFVVCNSWFAVRGGQFGVCGWGVRFVVCGSGRVLCGVQFVVCSSWCAVRGVWFGVCGSGCAVRGMQFGVCMDAIAAIRATIATGAMGGEVASNAVLPHHTGLLFGDRGVQLNSNTSVMGHLAVLLSSSWVVEELG